MHTAHFPGVMLHDGGADGNLSVYNPSSPDCPVSHITPSSIESSSNEPFCLFTAPAFSGSAGIGVRAIV